MKLKGFLLSLLLFPVTLFSQSLSKGWDKDTTYYVACYNKAGDFYYGSGAAFGSNYGPVISHKNWTYTSKISAKVKVSTGVIRGVYFSDSTHFFVYANSGGNGYVAANVIYKTDDAGVSYTRLTNPISDSVNDNGGSIRYNDYIQKTLEINKDTFFFLGSNGKLAWTGNAGSAIKEVKMPKNFKCKSFDFLDSKTGVVLGYNDSDFSSVKSMVYTTTDGGTNWKNITGNITGLGNTYIEAFCYAKMFGKNYMILTHGHMAFGWGSYISKDFGNSFTTAKASILTAMDSTHYFGVTSMPNAMKQSFSYYITTNGYKTHDVTDGPFLEDAFMLKSNEVYYVYGSNISTWPKNTASYSYEVYQYRYEPFRVVNLEAYQNVTPNAVNPYNVIKRNTPFRFKLKMLNQGGIDFLTVKSTLRSLDPGITVIDSEATFNNLLGGKEITSGKEYEIKLSAPKIKQRLVKYNFGYYTFPPIDVTHNFELVLTDQFSSLPVKRIPLNLNFAGMLNQDSIPDSNFYIKPMLDDDNNPDSKGDGDGIVEKGETVEMLTSLFYESHDLLNFLMNFNIILGSNLRGRLLSPVSSINVWNGKMGSTGTVNDEYHFSSKSNYNPPVFEIAQSVEDFVFDYNLNATYQIPFQMLFTDDVYYVEFENISNPGKAFDLKWMRDLIVNKGYPEIPVVSIMAPMINDNIMLAAPTKIKWDTKYNGNLKIDYSDNSGASWTTLSKNVSASAKEFSWTPDSSKLMPTTATSQIRISIANDSTIYFNSQLFSLIAFNGIEDNSFIKQFSVYPNPNNGTYYLQNKSNENYTVKVFDMNGKQVDVYAVNANTTKAINNDLMKQGLYTLQIQSERQFHVKKLMIVK